MDFAIPVFRLGTHSDKEEDRNDRVGTYRGIRAAIEIGWLLELENLESDGSNLEIYSVANRKPMQLRRILNLDEKIACVKERFAQVCDGDGESVGT